MTILQASPIGRFGAGYSLFMGTSGAFIAVSIGAVKAGGLPLLGTLVITCALFQFLLATRLGSLRKIVTPAVGGSVVMLIAVAVMPIAFHMLDRVPKTFSGDEHLPTLVSVVTFLVIVAVCLFGRGRLRLWGPLIGLIIGCTSV